METNIQEGFAVFTLPKNQKADPLLTLPLKANSIFHTIFFFYLLLQGQEYQDQRGAFNIIINPKFQINVREKSGTVVLAAGQYGPDRWKAGAGGCTYTFAAYVSYTVVTIVSGTLVQLIDRANIQQPEIYTLSWYGTAQERINSGDYDTSGNVSDHISTSYHPTVEFGVGTLSRVQLEQGVVATPYMGRLRESSPKFCGSLYPSRLKNSKR